LHLLDFCSHWTVMYGTTSFKFIRVIYRCKLLKGRGSNIYNPQYQVRYFFLKFYPVKIIHFFKSTKHNFALYNVRFGFPCMVVLLWDQDKITRTDNYKFCRKKGNIKKLPSPSSIIIIIIILFSVLRLVHSPFQGELSTDCDLMFPRLFPVPCPVLKVIPSSFSSFHKFYTSPYLSFGNVF